MFTSAVLDFAFQPNKRGVKTLRLEPNAGGVDKPSLQFLAQRLVRKSWLEVSQHDTLAAVVVASGTTRAVFPDPPADEAPAMEAPSCERFGCLRHAFSGPLLSIDSEPNRRNDVKPTQGSSSAR